QGPPDRRPNELWPPPAPRRPTEGVTGRATGRRALSCPPPPLPPGGGGARRPRPLPTPVARRPAPARPPGRGRSAPAVPVEQATEATQPASAICRRAPEGSGLP